MSQAQDWALEYARFHGLATDHRLKHPLEDFACDDSPFGFSDDAHLLDIQSTKLSPPPERLSVSKDAAMLLASIRNDPFEDIILDDCFLPNPHRIRDLKVETPLLRTDHDLDMQRFFQHIDPDLKNEHFPLEKVDEEQDEGFGWPSSYEKFLEKIRARTSTEKLSIPKGSLIYLQGVLKYHEGIDVQQVLEECLESSRKRKADLTVTPPLLPMSPEVSPFIPSSEVGHFELLSDKTSPTRDELSRLDQQILESDAIVSKEPKRGRDLNSTPLDSDSIGNIFSPLKGMKDTPLPSPFKRMRAEDFKVDGPLTPQLCDHTPPWMVNCTSFKENLVITIGDLPMIEKPENISSEDIDIMFEETIRPIAEGFDRHIEQEQLQEADTTRRVQVPTMDFSRPVPPWKLERDGAYDSTSQKAFLARLKEEHFANDSWRISRKEERALQWAPFPSNLARNVIHEAIEEDSLTETYIAQPECPDDSFLVWKPDGLRILDEDSSDDEGMENAIFPNTTDFESLIWRRKLELSEGGTESPPIATGAEQVTVEPNIREAIRLGKDPWNEETFSALDAITNFMRIRSCDTEKSQVRQNINVPRLVGPKGEMSASALEGSYIDENPRLCASTVSHLALDSAISMPKADIPPTPSSFIISSLFLSVTKITRQIPKLYPSAELIERDFTLHSDLRPSTSSRTAGMRSDQYDKIINEADIILSPGTGLIWTTLQKVKQKSLPGHTARSPVRDRILRTAPRYEKMVILMSAGCVVESNKTVITILDAQDYRAISEFISFCTGLQLGVEVIFTGGGEQELLTWTVSLMVKYSVQTQRIRLLQDETLWEIFLRRAGLNAFAAQAILVELKAPQSPPMTTTSHSSYLGPTCGEFGLVAFVAMSLEERFQRFEHLLGGRRLLRRVSGVIDAPLG